MSQAFSVFPGPTIKIDEVRPITAPPATNLDPPETGETSVTATGDTMELTNTMTTSSSSAVSVTVKFVEFPARRSYSYGVLEKKWSL